MSTVDPNQRFVNPLEGTGLSLFVVSIVGGVVSLVVVGLRTFVRLQARNFGLDDGVMLGGLVRRIPNAWVCSEISEMPHHLLTYTLR